MEIDWARNLLAKARAADIPYFLKQVTAGKPEQGADALGSIIREVPPAPHHLSWAEKHVMHNTLGKPWVPAVTSGKLKQEEQR